MKKLVLAIACLTACNSFPTAQDAVDARVKAMAICQEASKLDARARKACAALNDSLQQARELAAIVVEIVGE